MRKSLQILIISILNIPFFAQAQSTTVSVPVVTTTAVPFMTLTPDSKSAAMGDAGVASSPDANSIFWNTSKLAFVEEKSGVSLSYAPWLRDLISDMGLLNINAYKRISANQTITGGITYFDQGQIDFTTADGTAAGSFRSKEFALAGGIAQKLNENMSIGLNIKYINSNLVGTQAINGTAGKVGKTMAGDLGFYYNRNVPGDERPTDFAYGLVIQNVGGKINYGFGEYYIPANLKFGTKVSHVSGEHNHFSFLLDFNKLLVPTEKSDPTQTKNVSSFKALTTNFTDAPFATQVKLFSTSLGAEYSYDKLFALRTGYYHESNLKGGRKYITSGLGLYFKDLYTFDLAYLIPIQTSNPLANTWRISLSVAIP